MKRTLTIFTPTYNRKHTIGRTFDSLCRQTCREVDWLIIDDGSSDGTREWVESLGEKTTSKGIGYDWMGCPTDIVDDNHFVVEHNEDGNILKIEYIYKPNGGLYTGYNVAFFAIDTELCMCIDSDDYLPDDAVEKIIKKWNELSEDERQQVGGIAGLDYNVVDKKPIGGFYHSKKNIDWISNLHHNGDSKYVFRTELIKKFAPQIGFNGEKDFNPHYMQMQLFDKYPMVILNQNLCWVEYQIGADSMSQAIFKQYVRSPKSYARYRIMEMKIVHGNNLVNRYRLCAHYISACIFSKDENWLKNAPYKLLTVAAIPLGIIINLIIQYKSRN